MPSKRFSRRQFTSIAGWSALGMPVLSAGSSLADLGKGTGLPNRRAFSGFPNGFCGVRPRTVYDVDRIMYLRNYLTQLQRATSEGVPVLGYFLWSLMDNFEWSDGYEQRFGLYRVDFDTKRRTPKLSASFYRETIARNAVA
jgi:hypothetical protein